jgi:hypothetical protein
MIRQCCQCKKIEVNGEWVYPRFRQLAGGDISHGYCEKCFEAYKKKLNRQLHGRPSWRQWLGRVLSDWSHHREMSDAALVPQPVARRVRGRE